MSDKMDIPTFLCIVRSGTNENIREYINSHPHLLHTCTWMINVDIAYKVLSAMDSIDVQMLHTYLIEVSTSYAGGYDLKIIHMLLSYIDPDYKSIEIMLKGNNAIYLIKWLELI